MLRAINLPPFWLAGCMVLTWLLAKVHAPLGATAQNIGIGLVIAGIALAVWAGAQFPKAGTTFMPHQKPSALVDTGPFKFSRNPIYLGDLMILAGWSLALGTLMGLFLLLPFQMLLERIFIRPEEARLEAGLGRAYTDYRELVRRWI